MRSLEAQWKKKSERLGAEGEHEKKKNKKTEKWRSLDGNLGEEETWECVHNRSER